MSDISERWNEEMWTSKTMSYLKKPTEAFWCFILIILLLFLGVGTCVGNEGIRTGGPYYFERVEMKFQADFPLRPVGIMTEETAKLIRAYGIAYYDDQGRVIFYTKILDGKLAWSPKFYYSSLGHLEKEEYLSPDKELIQKNYDKSGLLIKIEHPSKRAKGSLTKLTG